MTDFDLSKLVREVHDTTDLTDHRQVAKEVREAIADDDLEEALIEALTTYVRVQFSLYRGTSKQPTSRPNVRSWKRDGAREWWGRHLHDRYSTAEGQKVLSEFTAEDVLHQIELCRTKIAELGHKLNQWLALYERLRDSGVETVGDLP